MTDLTTIPQYNNALTRWLQRRTVADALLVLVLALAALLRFVNLGQVPLSPIEAREALAVWSFWQPQTAVSAVSSPAYFTFTALLLPLLGDGDAIMRLIPALFGWALVGLPWLLRDRLGVVGALIVSILLLVSPVTAVTSRTAGGDAIALYSAALLAISIFKSSSPHNPIWTTIGFVSLGLGLVSAPLFYTLLLAGSGALLTYRWFTRLATPESGSPAGLSFINWRRGLGITLLTVLLIGTLLFWYPPGLGAAANILAAWLYQFNFTFSMTALSGPFLAALRYEPLLFLLGPAALVFTTWRLDMQQLWRSSMAYWMVWTLVVMVLQGSTMSNVSGLVLTGYLLTGSLISSLWQDRLTKLGLLTAGGLIFAGAVIFVNISRYLRLVTFQPEQVLPLWTAVTMLALALVTVLFVLSLDETAVTQGIILSLVALFFFYGWGTSWWLSHNAANDLRERWVTSATDDDVRLLVPFLENLSRQVSRYRYDLEMTSTVDTPALRWYLRGFTNLTYAETLPPGMATAVILTPTAMEPALGSDYMGADFGLERTCPDGRPTSATPIIDTLRWWLFQESPACGQSSNVIVWLRADLAQSP